MGADQSKTIEQTTEVFSESVFKSMTKVENECISKGKVSQTMSNKIDGTTFMEQCNKSKIEMTETLMAGNANPAIISAVEGMLSMPCITENVTISDMKQEAEMSIKSTCTFNNAQVIEIQDSISTDLERIVDNKEDGLGNAIEAVAGAAAGLLNPIGAMGQLGADTSETQSTSSNIRNMVNKEINNEFLTKVSTSMSAIQNMTNEYYGGAMNVNISKMHQKAKVEAVTTAFVDNSVITKAVTEVDNKEKESIKNGTKGLTDMIETVGDTVDNAVDTTGDTIENTVNTAGDVANNLVSTTGDIADGLTKMIPYMVVGGIVLLVLYFIAMSMKGKAAMAGPSSASKYMA